MAMGTFCNMARKLNGLFSETEQQDGKILHCMTNILSFAIGILGETREIAAPVLTPVAGR
jgi:hypothetical protein